MLTLYCGAQVRNELRNQGDSINLTLTDGPGRLPPASAQRFLAEDSEIAAVVLADHDDHYKNQ